MTSTLVAGIGNVFLGDDGFGVEVVHRIDPAEMPPGVDVVDYGIRGVHLAYELLDGHYDTLILVDAVPLEGEPGTVALLDASDAARNAGASAVDAHSMSPDVVLRTLHGLGGAIDRVYVVGCRPGVLDEGIGLSDRVAAAVPTAVGMVVALLRQLAASPPTLQPTTHGRTRP